MWKIISPWIGLIGSFFGIFGFVALFLKNDYAVILALSIFCLSILIVATYALYKISRYLTNTKPPFVVNSHFVKYETAEDAVHINFEIYRHIQCKQLVMTGYDHKFKWTGSLRPIISSKLQNVKGLIEQGGDGAYDAIRIDFKHPVVYNESVVTHFKAELDDCDKKSATYIEFKVENPVQIIHFRVVLKYKDQKYITPATLKKKQILDQTGSLQHSTICTVPFDNDSKSYEHHLIKPEVGYFYRLKWDR